jgi:hypothetical protein
MRTQRLKATARALLLGFAALAAGCSKPAPPTLTPEKAVVTRIDAAGMALDVSMSATNPNSVDLTASDVSSHVVVGAHDIGSFTLPRTVTLPAGKTTTLEVPVTLQWADAGLLAQLIAGSGAVPYSVDGKLEMGGALLHVGVPFHVEGTLAREQILTAAMHSLPLPR